MAAARAGGLLVAGALMHAGFHYVLPVGTFSVLMLVLYLAFLDPAEVSRACAALLSRPGARPGPEVGRGRLSPTERLLLVGPLGYPWPVDRAAEARRRARAAWTTRIFGPGEEARAEAADLAFWNAIPIDERGGVVWALSQEVFSLSPEGQHDRTGLSRSVVRIVRR